MKVLVLGGSSWDTLIHIDKLDVIKSDMSFWPENVYESVGGTGAGKALALSALGADVTLVTDLGNDDPGKKISNYLETMNITLIPLLVDKSTTHTNIMHSKGSRLSFFTNYPRVLPEFDETIIKELIDNSDIVFLNINEFCRKFIPLLENYKNDIIVDIHDYDPPNPYHKDFIEISNYLIVSDIHIVDKAIFLNNEISNGNKGVIITQGDKGLTAMDFNKNIYSKTVYDKLEFIDSNGAGDSFTAGFGLSLLNSNSFDYSLDFGTVCGSVACSSKELYNSNYSIEDIESILHKKKSF